jgi:hypothetical protein
MLQSTLELLKSVLRADPTLSPAERTAVLAQIRQGGKASAAQPVVRTEARLIRRAEAARRLSRSIRTVDKLAASGVLQKRKLPGRLKASGFLESDLETLILASSGASS